MYVGYAYCHIITHGFCYNNPRNSNVVFNFVSFTILLYLLLYFGNYLSTYGLSGVRRGELLTLSPIIDDIIVEKDTISTPSSFISTIESSISTKFVSTLWKHRAHVS